MDAMGHERTQAKRHVVTAMPARDITHADRLEGLVFGLPGLHKHVVDGI